ncbi:Na+/H+ antiporter NhaA [Usitatibacter palustris]|uniref:Na(+)/H(+) antiporter NhaA n=1 Tax=Usitatibacter palustris TaxID=2732487 RepID=A0A6M4HAS3_9PROT|nr:Na+/H+ antiporter NhaA [Usitatibacter palustris]QJR16676.1 Na(+)/H(+) antiporter NhaA [Usitatibacter palustris]
MLNNEYPLEPLFGRILSPFQRFIRRTTAGGIVLSVTTALTLVAASVFGDDALHHFFEQPFVLGVGSRFELKLTLHHLINDGLMALFFLMVGFELKREILVGELSSMRDAALPVFAAAGGMIVPAGIYAALNVGTPAAAGWGIPMATDIAFAVGILVLLAWRIPKNLIVFLMALAIADDLGAVIVIAAFYTADLRVEYLWASGAITALLILLNRAGVRRALPYALLGFPLWFFVHASGVHATLAGIILAFSIPSVPKVGAIDFLNRIKELREAFLQQREDQSTGDNPLNNSEMAAVAEAIESAAVAVQSPLQRLEHGLTPWVTFVVIPLFAVANAGIDLAAVKWGSALGNPLTIGVALGLVVGKFIGIGAFSWVAVKMGLARLPTDVEWKHVLGAAWLAGIGFTMSLFIAQLAFTSAAMVEQAKIGILVGSAISAIVGLVWLYMASIKRAA